MSKNVIRLTESELKTIITESVKQIISEAFGKSRTSNTNVASFGVHLNDIRFENLQLDDFITENYDELPSEEVQVEISYSTYAGDKGDYYTPPTAPYAELNDIKVDTNQVFANAMSSELYQIFIQEVDSFVENNYEDYIQEISYDEPEPDWDSIRKERQLRAMEKNNQF